MSGSQADVRPSQPRTYSHALALLSELQSNHAITHGLFSASNATNTPSPAPTPTSRDSLNALAIPEMQSWLHRAGITTAALTAPTAPRYIHVAGTKGKGSVTSLTASILAQYPRAAGRVGAYLSPHLVSVRERILLDGAPISRPLFARYFFEVWDRLTAAAAAAGDDVPESKGGLAGPTTKPFYFRFLTILALYVFLREGVRSAVVECGIGGEYDSTNVLPAEAVTAAVVTQLGIDHVAMLGGTLEEIAWHKAGVLKEGVTGFTRLLPPAQKSVMEVLRARAREKGARLVEVRDETVEEWGGVEGAEIRGPFQKYNVALATAAAREHLLRLGFSFEGEFTKDDYRLSLMPSEFETGLRGATLRGRCETFTREGVDWFVDGAHTVDSLAGVGQWFASTTRNQNAIRILVFNQQDRDRPIGPLLDALYHGIRVEDANKTAWGFSHAFFSRNEARAPSVGEPPRDLAVQEAAVDVVNTKDPLVEAKAFDSADAVVLAVKSLTQQAKSEGKACHVLVTGSFHLVAAVLKVLDPEEDA